MKYLVETALLTHGLKSVTNEEIRKAWPGSEKNIAWVSKGEVVIGDIEQFLQFRKEAEYFLRIDCQSLERAMKEGLSGALTASGTMAVCHKLGIPVAVTCGMGGIGDVRGEELCPDLPALSEIPVILISAGPKDMLEREKTVSWLVEHGVQVVGSERDYCSGYLFTGEQVKLSGIYEGQPQPPLLIIREIPETRRICDREILSKAIQFGKEAEKRGEYYHPAVNGKIDELTEGYSSRIQLEALLENMKLAEDVLAVSERLIKQNMEAYMRYLN